ncbi:TPA: hypothetical protein HA249_02190 [Candidatus Woesearchaeota archaeon]|nr:hypothetical protein [Candidatus Woesearchaeota archaeon]HIH47513.1 hypothetical protein [Candidatus Woesearchaeota archaeon]HII88369.1 hypothetical protein [Candidatus Woesearchaeota archaeon]
MASNAFDWRKVLYAVIVLLLYIPMVYLGTNVFFTKYSWSNSYYRGDDCYLKYPYPAQPAPEVRPEAKTLSPQDGLYESRQKCTREEEEKRLAFEAEKRQYDGWKYVVLSIINLIAMLVAIFVPLDSSILYGLFSGAVLTTFTSTWIYFESRSKVGFGLLVLVFILCVGFIQKLRKTQKR